MPMNTEQSDFEPILRHLSGIKIWVAVCAIGFLLSGVAAVVLSVFMVTMQHSLKQELEGADEESQLWDEASACFDRGDKEELLRLIEDRRRTHPNDPQTFWFSAKAHILDENWEAALAEVERAQLLAPSWSAEFTIPLSESLRRKLNGKE